MEFVLEKRTDGLFQPATAHDGEISGSLKIGAYKCKITQMNSRSIAHHRLFFGGLLPLAYQYWQPSGGMVTAAEQQAVNNFAARLESLQDTGGLILAFADEFLLDLSARRGQKLGAVVQSIDVFRKWLIVEAGYFTFYETPNGVRKEAKSISFANMSQDEFNVFYRDCFNVVWNMFLKHKFKDEEEAQEAVNELMLLGG